MPVAPIHFLTASFPVQPHTDRWVLSFPTTWIWEGSFGGVVVRPTPICARTHVIFELSHFVYTSQMIVDFSPPKNEPKEHTAYKTFISKREKSECNTRD